MLPDKIPPASWNAMGKLSSPAPRAAFTMRKTALYQEIPENNIYTINLSIGIFKLCYLIRNWSMNGIRQI